MTYTLISHGIVLGETELDMMRGTCGLLRPTAAAEEALPIFRRMWKAVLWVDQALETSNAAAPPPPNAGLSLEYARRLLEPLRSIDIQTPSASCLPMTVQATDAST